MLGLIVSMMGLLLPSLKYLKRKDVNINEINEEQRPLVINETDEGHKKKYLCAEFGIFLS